MASGPGVNANGITVVQNKRSLSPCMGCPFLNPADAYLNTIPSAP